MQSKQTDGIAYIEFNRTGQWQLKEDGLEWLDFRLQDVDFHSSEGTEILVQQLPQDIKDALVLVAFNYTCSCWQGYEGEWDCDENFEVTSHIILRTEYKEFTRELLTKEIELNDSMTKLEDTGLYLFADPITPEQVQGMIEEWEAFHDEDFVPFVPEKKYPFSL